MSLNTNKPCTKATSQPIRNITKKKKRRPFLASFKVQMLASHPEVELTASQEELIFISFCHNLGNFELNLFSLTSLHFSLVAIDNTQRSWSSKSDQASPQIPVLALNSIFLNGFSFWLLVQMNLKMQPILISWSRITLLRKRSLPADGLPYANGEFHRKG